MAIIIDWPSALKPIHALMPYIENNTTSSGSSITGIERLVSTDAGRWRYGFRLTIKTVAHVMAWRSLMAQTETRANIIRVPIEDCRYDVAATSGLRSLYRGKIQDVKIPHSDGALFSDGSGYSQNFVNGVVTSAATQGSTSITVTMPVGAIPQVGHHFGADDYFYRIKSVKLISGTTYTFTSEPRMRAAIPKGKELQFDNITCLMRFSYDAVSRVEMQLMKFSDIEVDFIEAIF
jgi:hypothetical protein